MTLWAQIVFVKLFGYNELALRLPSAIAAALTILLVFVFLYRDYSTYWAWAAVLILLTSQGFIGFHTARTAEADSLLTFFLLVSNDSLKAIVKNKYRYRIIDTYDNAELIEINHKADSTKDQE